MKVSNKHLKTNCTTNSLCSLSLDETEGEKRRKMQQEYPVQFMCSLKWPSFTNFFLENKPTRKAISDVPSHKARARFTI